jgi:hypothetical protein
MANDECGKTIDTGTIDRGSTVFVVLCIVRSWSKAMEFSLVGLFCAACCGLYFN